MPPTATEVNADLKGIQLELHRLEVSTAERIGEVKSTLGALTTRVNVAIGIACFLVVSTTGLAVKGLMDSAYWAGSVNTSIKGLEAKYDERSKQVDDRFDRLEASINERFAKVDARFEKVEAMLAKILEQTRNVPPSSRPGPEPR